MNKHRNNKKVHLRSALFVVLATVMACFGTLGTGGGEVEAISQVGSRGAEVRAIQQKLKERGLFKSDITGYYGDLTEAAVKAFQKAHGIKETGTADNATLVVMFRSDAKLSPAETPTANP